MIVTFVSECNKKAIKRTRFVLDAFANRIGTNVWQTVITEDGLKTVQGLLRKSATKNTAVSCHWIRSRVRSELVWIVGNRAKFNSQGFVAVNTTQKSLLHNKLESSWIHLPAIKALAAFSALLHDWGKATHLFQQKLEMGNRASDPLRHEWISCLLLSALVKKSNNSDEDWLRRLIAGVIEEQDLIDAIKDIERPFANLPPIAQLIAWLIVTHHRLPALSRKDQLNKWTEIPRIDIDSVLNSITDEWGYKNDYGEDDFQTRLKQCFVFPQGLLSQSSSWLKQLQKWASKLINLKSEILTLRNNGGSRLLLHHARLCLMLGDHYYSSCEADDGQKWNNQIHLYANTKKLDEKSVFKQKLDEHLVHVSKCALRVAHSLPRFTEEMAAAYDIRALNRKSPRDFAWQDKAVEKIKDFRNQHENVRAKEYGWFIVNMAGTGKGKTFANAKIMQALSKNNESLRYILALGLRTLTLQTGDEYRQRIGLSDGELAVLIGSAAIQELHEKNRETSVMNSCEEEGAESKEALLDEELVYTQETTEAFLDVLFPKNNPRIAEKNKAFLYKPVLVCTIDHIIASTETIKGGRYILPSLRLLSSDLVIDEVDDFDSQDLVAISRLVHLAGMLGRKVMISSATILPAIAEGLFNAYRNGWALHSQFQKVSQKVACGWVNEFSTRIEMINDEVKLPAYLAYHKLHSKFINKTVKEEMSQPAKRKALIVKSTDILSKDDDTLQNKYFERIQQAGINLHQNHHTIDSVSGKKVSFGLIRVANISPCIALTKYLLKSSWPDDLTPRVMGYHSRQILLLRHEQEAHLDQVLKRKEKIGDTPVAFSNPDIRKHIDSTNAENILFILVATPVEEVGRDHDFDWAVIEPSSYRSFIQLSGRVLRHRTINVAEPNVAIMQYNLRGLKKSEPAFCYPGYETQKSLKLNSHDLCDLVDEAALAKSITAIPRIQKAENLDPKNKLADLEHQAMINVLTTYTNQGPKYVQSWFSECWWLTALPQQFNQFRSGRPEVALYRVLKKGELSFCEKTNTGEYVPRDKPLEIEVEPLEEIDPFNRLWLKRDYRNSLEKECSSLAESSDLDLEDLMSQKSKRFGEVTIPMQSEKTPYRFIYSDNLGMLPIKTT